MYKIFHADKDTYITNKVIDGHRMIESNLGCAGSLDFFKLYGMSSHMSGVLSVSNIELSRVLIHFDIQQLKDMVTSGTINIFDSSFTCKMKLFDVYGGQPTPNNFTLTSFPLAHSFDEGTGKDVVFFSDFGESNFVTSSYQSLTDTTNIWYLSGANKSGIVTDSNIDFISSASFGLTSSDQYFKTGTEDLEIDITKQIKSIILNEIPDEGFRLSFSSSEELDNKTRFVKRFASRHAYDAAYHPQLIMTYDDSIFDGQSTFKLDSPCEFHLYNFIDGQRKNLTYNNNPITGSNCILFTISHSPLSGSIPVTFTTSGSQTTTGVYQTSMFISASDNPLVHDAVTVSGSLQFNQSWTTLDKSFSFYSPQEELITLKPQEQGNNDLSNKRFEIKAAVKSDYSTSEKIRVKIYITDVNNQFVKLVKTPFITPGLSLNNTYYSVRNYITNQIVIPFDKKTNSTRISADANEMFVDIDASNLIPGQSYVIDILTTYAGVDKVFRSVSDIFRILSV